VESHYGTHEIVRLSSVHQYRHLSLLVVITKASLLPTGLVLMLLNEDAGYIRGYAEVHSH
jgi:hypothetical protein